MSAEIRLAELAERWAKATASERANATLYLIELCEALGVEHPGPAGSGYQFELPIRVAHADGTEATNFVDLYKADCFLLEAKDEEAGRSNDLLLRRAFGQARGYVSSLPGQIPPYLIVLDVGRTMIVWDRWNGSYGGFNAGRRIDLPALADRPDDIALLQDIWTNPLVRNPTRRAEAVTRDVAARLGELAASLEHRGYEQERVARFLMRAVFTMFAEDIKLLPEEPFRHAIEGIGLRAPEEFAEALEELWRAMDSGKRWGHNKLMRFNGHFFRNAEALPLTRSDIEVLHRACRADWTDVEPAIFGTLFVRALDPAERHRLGAEFTPRAYVERVVRPTIEEPIRKLWTFVQAEVLQLRERGRAQDRQKAVDRLHDFHGWLRSLQVLDPACGSGNFLYVALDTMKRVELEVFREIEAITGQRELGVQEVNPSQFHGLEVKPWARELAELTLWIGYHQWWARTHGAARPPEPVLQDTGTFEHRDAVLAWDAIEVDPARERPDPRPRVPHPVTGQLVPDPNARLHYLRHVNARPAVWPRADFVIGNPPYMGNKRMREAFGDGYVEALRAAYPDVPDAADYVMYWWYRAAEEVAAGRATRAGLITTNSITQRYNRAVVSRAMERGAQVAWAVATHPWVDEAGSAAVRVAMTVLERDPAGAKLVEVDDNGTLAGVTEAERLNADLTAHADVATAASRALKANAGLSSRGFTLVGRGFVLEPGEAAALVPDPPEAGVVRPYLNGRDLTARPRGVSVIDFGLRTEAEALAFPVVYDLVRTRVKPDRDANKRKQYREAWWRFGEPRVTLREATVGLRRFIATLYQARHPFFTFLDGSVAADETLVCVASDDAFVLGVLSSAIHVRWSLAAGSRLGIGNDPRYNNAACFDAFAFPDADAAARQRIAALAERLDAHRKNALARDERVTMTAMYNVVEKLRAGTPLEPKERHVHDVAACGVLRDLHDELDRLVAQTYGWPWPLAAEEVLSRLVALHDARLAEEKAGRVRWLRPDFQVPRFSKAEPSGELELKVAAGAGELAVARVEWPQDVVQQLAAVRAAVDGAPRSVEEVAATFRGARRDVVQRHLEMLELLGELRRSDDGRFTHAPKAAVAAAA